MQAWQSTSQIRTLPWNNVEFMCGAICTHRPCTCAGTQLKHYSSEYCCTLQEDLCSFENGDLRYPTFTNGTVISKSDSCNGRCYNSYQHSSKLGRDAHYSCPDGRCLPVKDVRREMSWCGCWSLQPHYVQRSVMTTCFDLCRFRIKK